MKNKESSQRQKRVNELIKRILSTALKKYAAEESLLHHITLTEIRTSPDLKHATVLFTSDLSVKDTLEKLEGKKQLLWEALAKELHLKSTPKLIFKEDKNLEYAKHIEELLNSPEIKKDLQ